MLEIDKEMGKEEGFEVKGGQAECCQGWNVDGGGQGNKEGGESHKQKCWWWRRGGGQSCAAQVLLYTAVLLEGPDAGAEYVLIREGRKRKLTTRKGRAGTQRGRTHPASGITIIVDFLFAANYGRPLRHHS